MNPEMTPRERIDALDKSLDGVSMDFSTHGDVRWLLSVARVAVAHRERERALEGQPGSPEGCETCGCEVCRAADARGDAQEGE